MTMSRSVSSVLAVAFVFGVVEVGTGAQGNAAQRAVREKAIIAAEHKLIEAVAAGDAAAFKAMVDADAWSVSPRGPLSLTDFVASMKDLKLESGWTISEPRVVWAASNTAVLFYRLTGKATFMGQPLPPVVFASTIWHESNKKWTAVFHQETPAVAK